MEDIIIRGGTVLDGSGAPGRAADVAVREGKITRVGDCSDLIAEKELCALGLCVAPGFIDAHAHSDTAFLKDDSGASKLYQGITTEITGQCGDSPFPGKEDGFASFGEFAGRFRAQRRAMGVNQAIMVGHGTLRERVMGYEDREPTPCEQDQMERLLRQSLREGAWGLSLGLEYAPGCFAGAQELASLARVAMAEGAPVTCHMRSEGRRIGEAIDELSGIGSTSGAKVHISHLKLDHYTVHGQAEAVWKRIEAARATGVRLTADMYPYTASCTGLSIRCPQWSREGGPQALLGRLAGPRRGEVVEGIREHYFNARRAETCVFNDDSGLFPQIVGRNLRQVAEELLGTRDYAEAAAQVLERTRARANCIFFVMSEEDMLYFLARDVAIGSDGWALSVDPARVEGKPHPRSYGSHAEFLRLVREKSLCALPEAIRRITSKPAALIGMTDRGLLSEGKAADVTVFDPETIAPRATYQNPVRSAQGVAHVVMEGRLALQDGRQTGLRCGQFLRSRNRSKEYGGGA